jgi:hypothetical protein
MVLTNLHASSCYTMYIFGASSCAQSTHSAGTPLALVRLSAKTCTQRSFQAPELVGIVSDYFILSCVPQTKRPDELPAPLQGMSEDTIPAYYTQLAAAIHSHLVLVYGIRNELDRCAI